MACLSQKPQASSALPVDRYIACRGVFDLYSAVPLLDRGGTSLSSLTLGATGDMPALSYLLQTWQGHGPERMASSTPDRCGCFVASVNWFTRAGAYAPAVGGRIALAMGSRTLRWIVGRASQACLLVPRSESRRGENFQGFH